MDGHICPLYNFLGGINNKAKEWIFENLKWFIYNIFIIHWILFMLTTFPEDLKMILLLTPKWTMYMRKRKIGNIYANQKVSKVAIGWLKSLGWAVWKPRLTGNMIK